MPARILVVDDYPVVRRAICDLLHSHSLDICGEAENGLDAVERVKELRPNLVLLDINMPKMNGIQAAFEIHQLSPSTKIIFLERPRMLRRGHGGDASPRGSGIYSQIGSWKGVGPSPEAPVP